MNDKLKALLKSVFDEDEMKEIDADLEILKSGDAEKVEKIYSEASKEIESALNTLDDYTEDMPQDVLTAFKTLTKYASYGYPIEKTDKDIDKAGAKLSKYTQGQIIKALSILKESPKAIDILKALLGQDVKKIDDAVNDDEDKISPETQAKLDKLAEYQEKEKKEIEKARKEKEELEKDEKEKLIERLEILEKEQGIKKSIDDSELDDDEKKKKKDLEKDDKDPLPSIPVPVINRQE